VEEKKEKEKEKGIEKGKENEEEVDGKVDGDGFFCCYGLEGSSSFCRFQYIWIRNR
jgi:hypothetical protein